MKTVAVVPMKLNSQRLPQKNIRPFTGGKPLCHYILSTLLKVPGIQQVYVYCSDPGICAYLPSGVEFLQRSRELDLDSTKINQVLQNFCADVPADVYVMTHATAPFITASSIAKGLEAVASGGYDSALAVRRMQDFLWKDGSPYNYSLDNIPRTQDLPPIYQETSGFYIYNAQLMEQLGRRVGYRPFLVEVGEIEGIDIDEAEDFFIADAVFNFRQCAAEAADQTKQIG